MTVLERVRALHPGSPVWRAQPRQAAFLKASEFEVLYGGAAGGGKTDALLVAGLRWVQEYGAQVLFLRRTYPDLSMPGGAIPRSHELYHGHGTWNGSEHRWSFANGGTVQFGHLEHATAHMNYRGAQIDLLLWDELTQALLEQYLFLRSRVRATKPGVVTAIRAATNPGDVGHAWVRQRWVDAAPWGDPFHVRTAGAEPVTARFIPARVDDNQELLSRDPGYKDRLAELPDHLRRAYLDGDWDIYEGQYFAEWRREKHVCRPFEIPADWPRWYAHDYGFADPFCGLWLTRGALPGQRRRVYVYREVYGPGLRDEQQAMVAKAKSAGERLLVRLGDPSMFNVRSEQGKPSIASVFEATGFPLERASNQRVAGWSAVRRALALDDDGEAGLQVFDTCVNLIRTLPAMVHDPIDPEDLADKIKGRKTEDHACLVAGTPIATEGGSVPIETIAVGTHVWTRDGLRPVVAAAMTAAAAPVLRVTLSDGRVFSGTGNHPVWVDGRGFVRVDTLSYGDIITIWHGANESSSTASCSAAIRTRRIGRVGSTSRHLATIGNAASVTSTRRFGSRSTGRSRRVTTSTTPTPIRSTTTRRTSFASPRASTTRFTGVARRPRRSADTSRAFDRWPLIGIEAMQAGRGTASTDALLGRHARASGGSASSVAVSSTRSRADRVTGSARTSASRPGAARPAWTTSPSPALRAVSRSCRTSTNVRRPARVSVVSVCAEEQRQPVFNLAVAGCHEYFAAGVLMHNCDVLRYALMGTVAARPKPRPYGVGLRKPGTGTQLTPDERSLLAVRKKLDAIGGKEQRRG